MRVVAMGNYCENDVRKYSAFAHFHWVIIPCTKKPLLRLDVPLICGNNTLGLATDAIGYRYSVAKS